MPLMSGNELARQLCAKRPGLAVVLCMSGYSDETIVHRGPADARIPLLTKPVTPDQLRTAVAEALDRA
jgi:FixJ family two-component response regulator